MSTHCLICGVSKSELANQRRYNNRTIPCTAAGGRHKYAGRKPRKIKINPNQSELAIESYKLLT